MPAKGGKSFASNPKKDKCAEKSLELFFEDLAAEVDAQPDPPDVVELDPPDAVQQDLEVGDGVAERVADEAPLELFRITRISAVRNIIVCIGIFGLIRIIRIYSFSEMTGPCPAPSPPLQIFIRWVFLVF